MKIYGIKNCDTVAKVFKWMEANGLTYEFHDYKIEGITKDKLERWEKEAGMDRLLNKRSTTWKESSAEEQALAGSREGAFKLMQEKTSMIKRPVIETGKGLLVGFDKAEYERVLLGK
jgi:arsenate reductase (glutaredoxin)